MKSNYGPKGEPIKLIWRNGLFVPESVAEVVAKAANAEFVFLEMLDAYNNEGRNVGASQYGNYAPSAFAKDKRGKGIQQAGFHRRNERLFARGVIRTETYGPPSKQRSRLSENDPSNLLPTPCSTPEIKGWKLSPGTRWGSAENGGSNLPSNPCLPPPIPP